MKRKALLTILLTLCLCLCVAFTACGGNETDNSANGGSESNSENGGTVDSSATNSSTDNSSITDNSGTADSSGTEDSFTDSSNVTDNSTEGSGTGNSETVDSGKDDNTEQDQPHEHSYGEWQTTKEPTCTEAGEQQKSCDCGDIITETIDATGHTEETVAGKEATCTEAGLTDGKKCTACGEIFVHQETISAKEHYYGDDHECDNCSHKASKGLKLTLNESGEFYIVEDVGECASSKVVIQSNYKGLPVTNIGEKAFKGYTKLTEITIPSSITKIGDSAFSGCTKLSYVHFNAVNMEDLSNGSQVFPEYSRDTRITVIIGNTVEKIPSYLFEYSPVQKVVFESDSSCTSIGDFAFEGCTVLESLTIPSSVTSIGESAFYYCKMTSIRIPDSVNSVGKRAFLNCRELKTVFVGSKTIGESAFLGCNKLTSVTIGSGVTNIGDSAFSSCTNLTQINFNATEMADLSENNRVFSYAGIENEGITFTIGSDVAKIPSNLFCPMRYVSSEMAKITSVVFEKNSGVTSIEEDTFYGCTSLTSIEIPSSVTSIGFSAFSGCTSLTSIEIPSSVTSIGSYAFRGCTSLTSIEIPSSVTSIGNDAFSGCTNLTICCEAGSQPDGWHSDWNDSNCPVVWGYKQEG